MMKLPVRKGTKPSTTSRLPHSQLDQHGPDPLIDKLHEWCFSTFPNVKNEHSQISVPGARALVLHKCDGNCNHNAFMIGREFAHIHPKPDNGSMHLTLPPNDATEALEKGWGESHYLVQQGKWPFGLIMVFSPRDEDELGVVQSIVKRSYEFATGKELKEEL